jgi:surface protein
MIVRKTGGHSIVNKSHGNYNCRNTKIKILIPHDNYTLTLIRNEDFITDLGLISWGDGRSGNLNTLYIHTYIKAGVYELQGHFVLGLGFEPTKSMQEVLIEVNQLSDKCTDLSKAFYNCINLKELNLENLDMEKIISTDDMITGCCKLTMGGDQ